MGIISILCCPECYATGLKLAEDSKEGLCSNLCVACSCWRFMTGFTSTLKKIRNSLSILLLVFGLRLIGRGFTAGKKLLCTLNLPCISKNTFRAHELKLLEAVQLCSEENMKAASKEVQNFKKSTTCGVSVDGSWQRRGHMSLNGCVSVISIDTGKILDLEVMTQYCKMCELNVKREHLSSDLFSVCGLAIHQNDHQARRRFVEWAQNEIAVVPDFHKRILFSDEAHFWLNGYVNKQNCRIWSEANPQMYVETPLHSEKLTVWCALWAGGIIGPYFFKNDEGHNVTVNGYRYRAMITNFFIPELNNHDVQELWFQKDGATCHTARATIDLLKDTFGDRLISRFGPVNWPPRSCDLTPLDYFLWGYVKSLVYAYKPQTLDHLEYYIRRVIADIRKQMLEKVIENWTSILDYIRASRGSPMPEIIFKM
ncbi:DUF4817 domain-containing protein [Trichonephila clavipes]|nr:DUF4817 domain-containing protein [Trichonephila clavipes]